MNLQTFAQPVAFDYDTLAADKADALRRQALKIRALVKTTTASVIEIGRDLTAVKQALAHGRFIEWVEAECGFTARTAENYIRLASFAEGKSETVSLLAPSTAYKLSSKSAAPAVVTEVLARVGSGAIVSDCEVKELLAEAAFNRRQSERRELESKKGLRAKRKRQRREAEAEAHQEAVRKEALAHRAIAQALIERLGADGVRFLLDQVPGWSWWEISSHLRSELGIVFTAEAAQ